MNMPTTPVTVQVALTPAQVACLRSILARLPEDRPVPESQAIEPPFLGPVQAALTPAGPSAFPPGKYPFVFLGQPFGAATLSDVFALVIDATATVSPEALEALASTRTRARRFIARHGEQVHLRSPHLPVTRTGSGWWISTNIGENDLIRALKALCLEAGLIYRRDITLCWLNHQRQH